MELAHEVEQAAVNAVQDGVAIPPLTHAESLGMAREELRRFVALIEALEGADWEQPTACSLWTVKDIVAHQAAHVTGFTSLGAFFGQLNPAHLRPYLRQGMSQLDAWNQSQVDLRRDDSPADLIAEIRAGGERFLRGRDRVPALLRAPKLPIPGFDQPRSFGYLFDLIYTRDMWMHRHDICTATGRPMDLNAAHDGRVVALIVRDLAAKVRRDHPAWAVLLRLTGPAGGMYHLGAGAEPAATVTMDALNFCVLTSGRSRAADALTNGQAALVGDRALAGSVVTYCENRVLY